MRTLLTGAGGYLGLHVVRELLRDGQELTAVVRARAQLRAVAHHPGLTILEADLAQHEQIAATLPGHDVCIHAALIWGERGAEFEMRDTAVAAKLFDSAGRAGLPRCVFVSSTAVHRPFTADMSEDDKLTTTDVYGATKAAGELFLRAACATHRMTGVVLRLGPVVGPPAFADGSVRSDITITKMVADAAAGRPIEVVRGEGRQFTDVSTAAAVARALSRTENPGPTYVCVDRELLTWEWIARLVVESLHSRSDVRVLPRDSHEPVPRFRTDRIEDLLGAPSDARAAMKAHIAHLARTMIAP